MKISKYTGMPIIIVLLLLVCLLIIILLFVASISLVQSVIIIPCANYNYYGNETF